MARKPKLDTILSEAVETARNSLVEIAEESEIGEHLGATAEGERLVTHRFVAHKKGYQGWVWFATLARVPRAKAKDLTVCEVGIIAGDGALLAPAWIPWADRLAKEEIEAAQAEEADVKANSDAESSEDESTGAVAEAAAPAEGDEEVESGEPNAGQDVDDALETPKSPARRQVRRRRTAQRTAARRRAAQRNRARKDG